MDILNQLLTMLGAFIITVLAVLIPYVGKLVGVYLGTKIQAKQQEIGQAQYEANKKLALDLVKIVEERFRLGELMGSKIEEFESLLTQKCTYITKDQVKDLRDLAVRTFDEEYNKYLK